MPNRKDRRSRWSDSQDRLAGRLERITNPAPLSNTEVILGGACLVLGSWLKWGFVGLILSGILALAMPASKLRIERAGGSTTAKPAIILAVYLSVLFAGMMIALKLAAIAVNVVVIGIVVCVVASMVTVKRQTTQSSDDDLDDRH